MIKMGSLFDGSGGFPLAATICGIEPIWASEIEPFPIRVTTKRFSKMKHLGNITELDGSKVEPVDIITFGSPCQSLSVAGKRKGLKVTCSKCGWERKGKVTDECPNCGEKTDIAASALFFESIRVIEEILEATDGEQPKAFIFENVPGLLSSSNGEDFNRVLEELQALGEGFVIDPNIVDAQFMGVPQRRKRVYIIGINIKFIEKYIGKGEIRDEGQATTGSNGQFMFAFDSNDRPFDIKRIRACAEQLERYIREKCGSEIQLIPYSMPWDTSQSRGQGEGTSGETEDSVGTASKSAGFNGHKSITGNICYNEEKSPCIETKMPPNVITQSAGFCPEQGEKTRGIGYEEEQSPTLRAGVTPAVISFEPSAASRVGGHCWDDVCGTLRAEMGDNLPCVIENHPADSRVKLDESGTVQTLTSRMGTGGGNVPMVMAVEQESTVYGICSFASNSMRSENPNSGIYEAETSRTLDLNGGNPACNQGGMAIVELVSTDNAICLQGSMIGRANQNGPQGNGINDDIAFTLNTTDKHAVIYALDRASYNQGKNAQFDISIQDDGIAQTIIGTCPGAVSYNDFQVSTGSGKQTTGAILASCGEKQFLGNQEAFSGDYHIIEPNYVVRRLTPLECCRLQGFPDFWAKDLETPNPTDEEITWWSKVFETHRLATSSAEKPKSRNQIIKWLKNPNSDSAEYKMWGNGIALPSGLYAMKIISQILMAGGGNKN